MPSKWIEHVKKYAKTYGLSYGCALSDPKVKSSYSAAKINRKTSVMSAMDSRALRDKKEDMKRKKIVPAMKVGMASKQLIMLKNA